MRYLIKFRLGKSVFERAIDPRFYIEDLRELGSLEVKIIRENIPSPEEEPTDEHRFEADVVLETDRPKEEILEILEFILEDGVEVEPLGENGEERKEDRTSQQAQQIPPALLENYKLETEEILSKLRQSLEELSENPRSLELINEVFRSFHTLKGNTGLILSYGEEPNLRYIHEITHRAESVLQKARDSGIGLDPRQVEILQELTDRLDDLFLAFSENREESAEDVFALLEELSGAAQRSQELIRGEELPSEISALLNVTSQYIPLYRELCSKGEITEEEADFFRRSLITLHRLTRDLGFEELHRKIRDLQNAFGNIDFREFCENLGELTSDLNRLIERHRHSGDKPSGEDRKTFDAARYVAKTNYLKVEERLVRDLMDIVGELSVFKEWVYLFAAKLQKVYNVPDAAKELKDGTHRFRSLMENLQRTVLEMRMIPVSTLFERFPKLVRDLSKLLGKKAKITVEGGETKLDKVIVERIAEPMVHLIRNAIDHGIEPPQEREKLGKPPEGEIRIKAYQEGGSVIIEVSDDGKGIDVEKVREKALEKGLYTREELSRMTEEEILQIVFQPGFSTKDRATELSGRGVGMDVVASTVREFGGEVSLQTQKSLGTTVKLVLPLTLAIRKILLVRIGEVTFGIPAEDVGEVLRISRRDIKTLKGLRVVYHRNSILELDFIGERLNVQSNANGTVTLLVDNSTHRALVVDDVVSTIDAVVKPVPALLQTAEEISGITILGDGSIVYVLEALR